jgi:hypothetical protein
MKISELLTENQQPKQPKSALPTAASINDAPEELEYDDEVDGQDEEETVNSERDFMDKASALGGGMYALSAWSYPDAWLGGGYSDMNMHTIATLADETQSDLGDYESLSDSEISDGRRLEVVIYNQQTQVVFRLSASGMEGGGSVHFNPDLTTLQQTGSVTNPQMSKLKNLETLVRTWCDSVPEDVGTGEPSDRRWAAAEKKVLGLFNFGGFSGGDEEGDTDSSDFWAKTDAHRQLEPEHQKNVDDVMAKIMARKKAQMAGSSAGREMR